MIYNYLKVWMCLYMSQKHCETLQNPALRNFIGFRCVKLFLLKYVTIITITTATVIITTITSVTITTVTTVSIPKKIVLKVFFCQNYFVKNFPLIGRFGLAFAMSMCPYVCTSLIKKKENLGDEVKSV